MPIYGILRLWTDEILLVNEMFTKEFAKIKTQKERLEEDVKDEFENYAPKCKKVNLQLFVSS